VYQKTDGSDWSAVNTGLPTDPDDPSRHPGVFALAIDSGPPTTLYAALDSYYEETVCNNLCGVFRWDDVNGTWVNTGAPTTFGFHALAVDPLTHTLYAGSTGGGVFKLDIGSGTWTNISDGGLTNLSVYALAFDPLTSTLYAGTEGGGAFQLGGGGWTNISTGMPNGSVVFSFALDSTTSPSSTLYAGTDHGGLFRLDPTGWTLINNGLPGWGPEIHTLAVDPQNSSRLWAGTFGGGLFLSTDGGNNWNENDTGITDYYFHALAFDPLNLTTLYTGSCNAGVFVLPPSTPATHLERAVMRFSRKLTSKPAARVTDIE
jgi:hypothetical protein